MTDPEILGYVHDYLSENHLYMRSGFTLRDDDSLFDTGIIDSMGVMELILFIESKFGVAVLDEDMTEENLESPAAIAAFVSRRLEQDQVAGRQTA